MNGFMITGVVAFVVGVIIDGVTWWRRVFGPVVQSAAGLALAGIAMIVAGLWTGTGLSAPATGVWTVVVVVAGTVVVYRLSGRSRNAVRRTAPSPGNDTGTDSDAPSPS